MGLRRSLIVVGALVVGLAACTGGAEPAEDPTATTSGASRPDPAAPSEVETTPAAPSFAGDTPAPEFPPGLDWLNTSGPLTLAELRGKVVLLDFWTYGCINCIHIIPDLKRLEAEYPEELVVIGVHSAKFVNESATDNIRQVMLRYDLEHPVVNDAGFAVWRAWGASAWPTTVIVDPAGNVVGGHAGEGVYEVAAPVIASLVAEFDAAGRLDRTPLPLALEKDRQPGRILSFPGKVHVVTGDSRLFIADTGHHRIVVADRADGEVLAVYGSGRTGFRDGPAAVAEFAAPQGLALDEDGVTLYVADTSNHAVRAIDTAAETVTTLLGTGDLGWPPIGGVAPDVDLASPWDVLVDGSTLYIAMAGHHQIWSMDLAAGLAAPLVGSAREGVRNGPLLEAELAQPSGLALGDGGRLYFADAESSSIRYADVAEPATGATGLVAGGATTLFEFGAEDGRGEDARFQHPLGVAVWGPDAALVVADTYNSRLRRVDPLAGEVTTLLGAEQGWRDGAAPLFFEPGGLAIDGDTLYVADTNNHAVRIVDLPSGDTSTLVLKGIQAFEPPPETAGYRGTVVRGDPVALAAGPVELVVEVALPPGHKVNDEAPSSLTLSGEVVAVLAAAASDLTGVTLPVRVPIDVVASGELTADLTLIYCRDDAQSLCLIEQVRFVVPVRIDPGGGATVALTHRVDVPAVSG